MRRISRTRVGRFGLMVILIGAGGAPVAAQSQSTCLAAPVLSVLDGVTDTRRAVDVLTDHLDNAGGELPQGVQNALQRVTSTLDRTASQVQVPREQVVELVCNLLRLPENVLNTLAAQGAAQSGVALVATGGLTGAILGRLDASRGQGGGGSSASSSFGAQSEGRMSLGATDKARPAPPPGSVGPFTIYASGTFLAGNSADRPEAAGFSYDGGSGLLGLEYSVNRNLILGLAGSFTAMDADLNAGGTVGAEVFHGAAYLSYATKAWFFDALAAYGAIDLDLTRPGANIGETVRGSTSGGALAVAGRSGYLFDLGKVRAGPIAGLTYVRARIDGYTETGNDPSTMIVGDQTVDSLTGSAGLRFLAPFQAGGMLLVPYLNVTLEHQFGDDKAELTTSLTGSPSSPLSVSFPTFGARDYGKVEGGLTVELAPEASVSLSGASTFARDDGHDYRVSAGLNYRF
jgi:outer membrane lipase/esterase